MITKTVKVPDFKAGDILYVGNQDNLGFMFVKYARERGFRAWLIMQGRGINRSDPDYFGKGLYDQFKSYILPSEDLVDILKYTERCSGLNIISTGIEIMIMLQYATKNNNYYLIPTGSDLAMWPFVDENTAILSHYLKYRDIFYQHRFKIKAIFTSQLDCIYAAIALGLKDRLVPWIYPVPLDFIDKQSPYYLVDGGKPDTDPTKRLIFLPCRKNGDKKYTHYKGVQLIIEGLDYFCRSASEVQLNNTRILNIDQSNKGLEYGMDQFRSDLVRLSQKYRLKIRHIRNLHAYEFWSFLKDPRMAVIDQFGQFHGLMGGIGREACCLGRPFLTGSLSTSDKHTKDFYGDSPPIFSANNSEEIGHFILNFTSLSGPKVSELSHRISAWARSKFDPKKSFDTILEIMSN